MMLRRHFFRSSVLLALLMTGSAHLWASPRALPREQAARFCQLFFDDGQGQVRLLHTYAQNLVTMLCGEPRYGDYTAEQVFTGLIFYHDDWVREPFLQAADAERQQLVYDLCSGVTLRIFPNQSGATDGAVSWYAPTERLPENLDAEHRRYMQEVFTRLNGEVNAENWKTVDAYIDSMIKYQCQFGGSPLSSKPSFYAIIAIFFGVLLTCFALRRPLSLNTFTQSNAYGFFPSRECHVPIMGTRRELHAKWKVFGLRTLRAKNTTR